MSSAFNDITAAMRKLKHLPVPDSRRPTIKAGSLDRLWNEIERVTGREVKSADQPVASMNLSGINVCENSALPPNIVVFLMGDEIQQVINLDRKA